jgi:predicted porin
MKQLAALALACGSAVVHAQTSVTFYGIVDAALVVEDGGANGRVTKVTSGAGAASRFGFRGAEEFGNGVSVFFILEGGAKIDTGEIDAAGTIFNRQSLVGLRGAYGAVALGRQYTPYHTAMVTIVDPFSTGYAGSAKSLFPHNGTNIRTSNTITYATPKVNGFDAELAYSVGEQGDSSVGRQFGGALGYADGALALRLVYNNKNTDVPASGATPAVERTLGSNYLLAASYKLARVKLHAGFGVDKGFNAAPLINPNNPYGGVRPTPSTDGRNVLLGITAPIGGGTLMASVLRKDDRTAFNQDANAWGIGYLYALSKRTGLYAAYGHVDNRNGAGYTIANNTEAGSGDTGYNLGIRHSF